MREYFENQGMIIMQNKKLSQGKSWLINIVLFGFLTLLLSSCDNNDKAKETINTPPPQDTSIILSPDGIGPINATTSFNIHQMTLAFNQYSVVEEINYQKGNPFPAIRISEGVNTILNIIPDASHQGIYSVIVEDNIIKNSLGHPLGTLYNEIYSYGQNEQCQAGAEDLAGKMLCYAPKHPNILYVFNGTLEDSSSNKAPSADILQGWALESIIWRPKN
ncbi:MAG: hypothetical protein ACI88H_002014 [Cocleimonas sp.]|jgi:hypothetical protein